MFCPQCGHKNPDSAKFCMGCGWDQSSSELQPSTLRIQSTSDIRPLMIAIWNAYGIENTESNDSQGMANQLKNLMKKCKLDRLPYRGYVQESADGLLVAIMDADQRFELKDLKMLSVMPDLLASDFGQRTHWSDEIGTHERLENYEAVVSCEALRKHASELIAAIGQT